MGLPDMFLSSVAVNPADLSSVAVNPADLSSVAVNPLAG